MSISKGENVFLLFIAENRQMLCIECNRHRSGK